MKAEIKGHGELTITPETDTEQYALAWFMSDNALDDGSVTNVVFAETKESDIMVDYVESTHFVGWPEELKPDKECREWKTCTFTGGCVDPSMLKGGNEGELKYFPDKGKITNPIHDYIIKQANLERDEILKKAREEAGSIKSKAIDHYHEMSSCGADKIADGVREAGRIVREAKENAAQINAKAMNVSESIVRTAHGRAEMIVEQANTDAEKIKANCNDGHIEIELERGEYKSTFHFNPGAKVSISKSGDVTLHKKG